MNMYSWEVVMLLEGSENHIHSTGCIAGSYIHWVQWSSLWRARLWHTSAWSCKNENGICTQAELQPVFVYIALFNLCAKTRMGNIGKGHNHLVSLLDTMINYHAPFSPEMMMIIIDHDSNVYTEWHNIKLAYHY